PDQDDVGRALTPRVDRRPGRVLAADGEHDRLSLFPPHLYPGRAPVETEVEGGVALRADARDHVGLREGIRKGADQVGRDGSAGGFDQHPPPVLAPRDDGPPAPAETDLAYV